LAILSAVMIAADGRNVVLQDADRQDRAGHALG
jgi:hypothetical protein